MLEAGPELGTADRSSLHFRAASLLDRAGRFDEAFQHAANAHALRNPAYDRGWIERLVRDFTGYFTSATLRRLPRATHGSQTPVFAVGMPRSGSTLAEQILASHPAVFGAGELTWVFQLWQSAVRRRSDPWSGLIQCVDRLTASDLEELAGEYLRPLGALSPESLRIIDKLPMNLLNLGLIALLFPNARVIYCRRDPLDTCLSCYLTDLKAGNQFSFDLRSSGHLYRHCAAMMSHWQAVLDLPILEVVYEQVVEDVEGQARRMLEFLDLPWDDRCLRFYENDRPVETASREQVRKPIYRDSVGRWRHYDAHLGPLRDALGIAGG